MTDGEDRETWDGKDRETGDGKGRETGDGDRGIDAVGRAGSGVILDGDAETRRALRAIAEDVRGENSESQQVAAILYRVSDLYDPAEDTSPEAIYRNVRQIMRVKARGGLDR
ncbi:hypothetical protein [Halopenitus sp. POP-27]|uniref:hypothetical protein n=1 Tax=Halopenitus sp. POP-27 TaxID=2994425 RepID=UPI002468ACFC|nr:hypothetical protein [Halopenitus sp. POP-27]